MKKILFILAMFVAVFAQSQIQVTQTSTIDLYKARAGAIRITKITVDSTSQYVFYFKDAQYTQISDYDYIVFHDTTEVRDFFNLVLTAINDRQDYTLKVGDQTVFISKSLKGVVSINNTKGFCYVNQKEAQGIIDSLK